MRDVRITRISGDLGSGKTTLALSAAHELSKHKKVILIDDSVRVQDLEEMFGEARIDIFTVRKAHCALRLHADHIFIGSNCNLSSVIEKMNGHFITVIED